MLLRLLFFAPILTITFGAMTFALSGSRSTANQATATISATVEAASSACRLESDQRRDLRGDFLDYARFTSGQVSTKNAPISAGEVEYPRDELFLGYSHVRFGVPGSSGQTSFAFNGGSVGFAYNLNRWLALAGEFSLYSVSTLPSASSGTYLFGPRFSRRTERFHLYVQSLLGGATLKSDIAAPASATFFGNTVHASSFAAA